ncbi:MAG: glycosyltransferase [Cyanobacteria bacterium J06621_8]
MALTKISVIIPTYHRNDLLAKCLDYLAPEKQILAVEQYEVIVTDDGVETTAEQMINEHYPWVKWVEGPHQGPAANRNNGAKYAQGEWLAFTDDDCLPKQNWLSSFVSAITSDVFVYEGKTTCEAGVNSPLEQAPLNLDGGWLWSCNMMIATKIFKKIGGFDESYPYPFMEDQDLRERIKKAGFSFPFIADAIVDHPPRKRVLGFKLGASWESFVYYWRRTNKKQSFKVKLIKEILMHHGVHVFRYPVSLDYINAMISLAAELAYVLLHIETWNKKYRSVEVMK